MIFDYDVHHGNGTHDIFYDDPDILFVSTHQQGSYPGTGKLTEVGTGDGQHATINIPLPGVFSCCCPCLHSTPHTRVYKTGSGCTPHTRVYKTGSGCGQRVSSNRI